MRESWGTLWLNREGASAPAAPQDVLKRAFRQPGIVQTAREANVSGDISSAEAIYKSAMQGNGTREPYLKKPAVTLAWCALI